MQPRNVQRVRHLKNQMGVEFREGTQKPPLSESSNAHPSSPQVPHESYVIDMTPDPCPIEYDLSLSDGSSWWLSGWNDLVKWVDKLSAIMELRKSRSSGSPKLVFFTDGVSNSRPDVSGVAARLSSWGRDAGWVVSNPASLRVWCDKSVPDAVCEVDNFGDAPEVEILSMRHAILPIYQRSMGRGGVPLHAALVERSGRGFLLAGSGAAGKSTCCERLPDYWQPLCDDEALVVLDKEEKYRAHPFPTWSDYLLRGANKTWNVQHSVPLSGVFFLEQSEIDEVTPIGEGEAAVLMTESATQICQKFWGKLDKEDQKKSREELFNNACEMAKEIPAYRLHVSRQGRFWEKIEQVLDS